MSRTALARDAGAGRPPPRPDAASQRALDELTRRASDVAAYQIAQIHAFRGDRGVALQREPAILIDPVFRPLRGAAQLRLFLSGTTILAGVGLAIGPWGRQRDT